MTIIALNFSTISAQQVDNGESLPEEAAEFVTPKMKATRFVKADLNGDKTQDYIIILDDDICRDGDYYKEVKRTLVIVVRDRSGKLRRAALNENVVFCRNCPSGYEDGFADIIIDKNGFTIWNTVGKIDRKIFKYSFVYAPRLKTWRLEKFEKTDYNTVTNRIRNRIYTAPRNFAPVNFAAFDPSKLKVKK